MNIFVARLNYDTTEGDLRATFEQFGDVDSVKIIMDRETGRSKGYGFVEMANDDEGNEAIAALNDFELDGRQIAVKESQPQPQRKRFGGGGGGYNRDNRGGGGDRRRRY